MTAPLTLAQARALMKASADSLLAALIAREKGATFESHLRGVVKAEAERLEHAAQGWQPTCHKCGSERVSLWLRCRACREEWVEHSPADSPKPQGQAPFSDCPRCEFYDGRWYPCHKHQPHPAVPQEPSWLCTQGAGYCSHKQCKPQEPQALEQKQPVDWKEASVPQPDNLKNAKGNRALELKMSKLRTELSGQPQGSCGCVGVSSRDPWPNHEPEDCPNKVPQEPQAQERKQPVEDTLHAVFTRHGIASRADLPHALISDLIGWAAMECRHATKSEPAPSPLSAEALERRIARIASCACTGQQGESQIEYEIEELLKDALAAAPAQGQTLDVNALREAFDAGFWAWPNANEPERIALREAWIMRCVAAQGQTERLR